jgi:hypothetical protein
MGGSGSSQPSSSGSSDPAQPRGSNASGNTTSGNPSSNNPAYNGLLSGLGLRDRNGRPVVGTAVARSTVTAPSVIDLGFSSFSSPFSPWGRWYPWYSSGFGSGFGYVTMNPWSYGSAYWVWGRNGLWWYDPWYDPYAYGEYPSYVAPGGVPIYGSPGFGSVPSYAAPKPTGSVRLKISPSAAKVYVDGTLKGTVSEFDGLTHHLGLEAGSHHLEIKADGYQAYSADITVEAGQTTTYRATLKKQ